MREYLKFYIDGAWVDPIAHKPLDVINPANEKVAGCISMGSAADVDLAAKAARKAFTAFSRTTREERIDACPRVPCIQHCGRIFKRNVAVSVQKTEETTALVPINIAPYYSGKTLPAASVDNKTVVSVFLDLREF